MQEKILHTSDKIKIAINHYDKGNDKVLIIIPGWFMTKDSNAFLKISKAFAQEMDVICLDCRGHGKSSGFYTFTAKETNDIKSVVEFAKSKYKKVYLAGFSLGGALALIHGGISQDVDKIIAISAPSSFIKIENQMWHYNAWFPTIKKFEFARWISIRPSIVPFKKIKPIDIIKNINVPTLFIAGGKDVTVKKWHTEKLFELAVCKKKYVLFENSIHAEDIFLAEEDKFMQTCLAWLRE